MDQHIVAELHIGQSIMHYGSESHLMYKVDQGKLKQGIAW